MSQTSGLLHPLRTPTFRNLIVADVVSDIGTFMQSVGAAWLMVSLNAGPLYVALIQTASSLPFFIFALPAGAIGDIADRRKLILFTETWMACFATVLTVATVTGHMTPLLLLILTFALSAGDAFESPTWRAVLPELVGKDDLASAAALNGIEFNLARAVGPALAGFVIAAWNVATAFAINAASFLGVLFVVARWKRPTRKSTAPPETLGGATAAAIRYVRYSPEIRTLFLRSGSVMFFASGLLALLPSLAHNLSKSPLTYGVLLGCFGFGAVAGAAMMQRGRARWSTEAIISTGVVMFGLSTIAAGAVRSLPWLGVTMLTGGASWLVFISLFNVIVLNQTPDWVRARVLAVSMLIVQGAMAGGSAIWGALAAHIGVSETLMCAGVGILVASSLALFLKLPDAPADLTPLVHGKMPTILATNVADADSGPILVTVEYVVLPGKEEHFLKAVHRRERLRRRDGAYRWGIFRDLGSIDRYVETFLVDSWAEHLRQHQRSTQADRAVGEEIDKFVTGTPTVRHMVYALDQE